MEEKIITFETAKLANEIGLWDKLTGTDYVKGYYSEDYVEYREFEMQLEDHDRGDHYYSPTQSLLQTYIRITYGLAVVIKLDNYMNWTYQIVPLCPSSTIQKEIFSKNSYGSDYDRCLEEGLFECLTLIKNHQQL